MKGETADLFISYLAPSLLCHLEQDMESRGGAASCFHCGRGCVCPESILIARSGFCWPVPTFLALGVINIISIATFNPITNIAISTLYWIFSLILNAGITLIIVTRLLWLRRTVLSTMGKEHGGMYTSIMAMLVESSLIYSLAVGLGFPLLPTAFGSIELDRMFSPLLSQVEVSLVLNKIIFPLPRFIPCGPTLSCLTLSFFACMYIHSYPFSHFAVHRIRAHHLPLAPGLRLVQQTCREWKAQSRPTGSKQAPGFIWSCNKSFCIINIDQQDSSRCCH